MIEQPVRYCPMYESDSGLNFSAIIEKHGLRFGKIEDIFCLRDAKNEKPYAAIKLEVINRPVQTEKERYVEIFKEELAACIRRLTENL